MDIDYFKEDKYWEKHINDLEKVLKEKIK